ncbi:MAG: SCO family protein [Gammaproteobacteria bacterium]|nr:SCO family protein [Gammaproteobacteria bacterium]
MNNINSGNNDSAISSTENRPSNNPLTNNNRNPYTVWFVVLSFLVPVALAYIMYFFVDVNSFSNHGEILDPIISIVDLKLKDESSEVIAEQQFTHQWALISFLGKECDQPCAKRLYDTRQIHTSLGKDKERLKRIFIHLDPADEALLALLAKTHPNVMHVNGEKNLIMEALGKNIHDATGISNNEVYIMDPLGNIMMRFTQEQSNRDFLTDLKKLLKVSQIG